MKDRAIRQPPTIDYIRDELRHNRYTGDLFDALVFLLKEYDNLASSYYNDTYHIV